MTEQENFKTVLFEGLGTASMAWSETPKGVFDEKLANKVGKEIYDSFLSERDKFAMDAAKWMLNIGFKPYNGFWFNSDGNGGGLFYSSKEIIDLYKQSLTDKAQEK